MPDPDGVTATSGDWIITAGIDGSFRLWHPFGGADVEVSELTNPSIWSLAAIPANGRPTMMAAGDVDGVIQVRDLHTGRTRHVLHLHDSTVAALTSMVTRAGHHVLISADANGSIRLTDLASGLERQVLSGHTSAVNAILVTEIDGVGYLVAGDGDGMIRMWDPHSGEQVRSWRGQDGLIWAMATLPGLPGGVWLASAGIDGRVRCWDLLSGTEGQEALGQPDGVIYDLLSFADDSGRQLLAVARLTGQIQIWDATTGGLRIAFDAQQGPVRALAAARDAEGRVWVVSGGGDGSVRCWDPVSGTQAAAFDDHWGSVLAVASVQAGDGTRPHVRDQRATAHAALAGRTEIRTLGFDDRAATIDLLGRDHLVNVIVDVLLGATRRAGDSGPSVVSVEGPWGAGKTTIMQLIRQRLDALDQDLSPAPTSLASRLHRSALRRWRHRRLSLAEADMRLRKAPSSRWTNMPSQSSSVLRPVPVWFNPWAHQSSEQVWAGLTREIIGAAQEVLVPHPNMAERYWFNRNLQRLDRREVKRQLWRRLASPVLRLEALAILAPIVALAISLQFTPQSPGLDIWGQHIGAAAFGFALLVASLAAGVLHSGFRYLFGHASSFLPGDVLHGPVVNAAPSRSEGSTHLGLRDPLYEAASGLLYLLQHDVQQILEDAERAGYQIVVFIDDLDRCSPKTTTEVFEAINLFLSREFPPAHFVLALDPVIVSAHIDSTYAGVPQPHYGYSSDPSPGWTFLRKLIQLPITAPAVNDFGTDRMLEDMLGAQSAAPDEAPMPGDVPRRFPGVVEAAETGAHTAPPLSQDRKPESAAAPAILPPSTPGRGEEAGVDPVTALDTHPEMREFIRLRLAEQVDRSPRHTKRLLNVWQFYVRLLERVAPTTPALSLRRSQLLVVVAEILTRWPAQLRYLRAGAAGSSGIQQLAACRDNDAEWDRTTTRLGIAEAHHDMARQLRYLLISNDGPAIADLLTAIT